MAEDGKSGGIITNQAKMAPAPSECRDGLSVPSHKALCGQDDNTCQLIECIPVMSPESNFDLIVAAEGHE